MDDSTMGKGPMMEDEGTEMAEDESNETPSVFLSRENLGGRECKPGDKLTLTVRDVDPETGDVQADLEGSGATTESAGYASDFEKSVPAEEA